MGSLLRRLRGALGNALVWGAGWYAAAMIVYAALRVVGIADDSDTWGGAFRSGLKFGVMGAIAGGAFSSFIGLRYHGRRLSEINWLRFGIGGGIVTGLFVPAFIVVMRLLSGDPFLPLKALLLNGLVGVVLGGTAAGASLKLAQLASNLLPDRSQDRRDLLEKADHSLPAEKRAIPRSRASNTED